MIENWKLVFEISVRLFQMESKDNKLTMGIHQTNLKPNKWYEMDKYWNVSENYSVFLVESSLGADVCVTGGVAGTSWTATKSSFDVDVLSGALWTLTEAGVCGGVGEVTVGVVGWSCGSMSVFGIVNVGFGSTIWASFDGSTSVGFDSTFWVSTGSSTSVGFGSVLWVSFDGSTSVGWISVGSDCGSSLASAFWIGAKLEIGAAFFVTGIVGIGAGQSDTRRAPWNGQFIENAMY